jgi:hypothetical protein
MIKEIRDYFREAILSVDSDLVENPSAFLDSDIGESLIDRSFQIEINGLVKTVRNANIERSISAKVTIFGHGYRDQISNYDELLDKAICIEDEITNIQNLSKVATITNIISDGIEPSRYPDADDAFRIDINLTLTQAYSRE